MNKIIHAIYENGVFRPVEAVDLPEHSNVEVELRLIDKQSGWPDGYFLQTAGVLKDEIFDRPDQGELPHRSDWQ